MIDPYSNRTGVPFHCHRCGKESLTVRPTRARWCSKYCADRWHRENNVERRREYNSHHNLKRYGITLEQYQKLLDKQQSRCAICLTDDPKGRGDKLHVDHCHTTGSIRGLLCGKCNTGLGLFNDNINILRNAIKYLEGSDV